MFKTGSCSFPFLYLHFFPVIKKKRGGEIVVLQNNLSLVPFSVKENFENVLKARLMKQKPAKTPSEAKMTGNCRSAKVTQNSADEVNC